MSRLILASAALLALIATGCDRSDQNQPQAYHQSAKMHPRPSVVIVPVIDNTKGDYEWNLSDELTSTIYYRLSEQEYIALAEPSQIRSKVKRLKGENPFGPETAWIKKAFQGDDYVVFLELVEHEEVYKQGKRAADPSECSADLNMSMRVRVFDLRGQEPKVVLQELVHDSHFIPRQFTQANFYQVPWGHESFSISPLGLAHAELTKEIASRLEDYILMSSRD